VLLYVHKIQNRFGRNKWQTIKKHARTLLAAVLRNRMASIAVLRVRVQVKRLKSIATVVILSVVEISNRNAIVM